MDTHMADRIMRDTMFQAIMSLSIMILYIYVLKKLVQVLLIFFSQLG